MKTRLVASALVAGFLLIAAPRAASAHCDTMSGPVVLAAQKALETRDVNHVLPWIQPHDEVTIRGVFASTLEARRAGGTEAESADHRFFEELVRIHRAGEGAPFEGLKPAGTDVGPAVAAADKAIESGSPEGVRAVLQDSVRVGVDKRFQDVLARRDFRTDDVAAGREYVRSYVVFTHYVEGLYDMSKAGSAHEQHADSPAAPGRDAHAHGLPASPGQDAHAHGSPTPDGDSHHGLSIAPTGNGHAGHVPWLLTGFLGLVVAVQSGLLWRKARRPPQST